MSDDTPNRFYALQDGSSSFSSVSNTLSLPAAVEPPRTPSPLSRNSFSTTPSRSSIGSPRSSTPAHKAEVSAPSSRIPTWWKTNVHDRWTAELLAGGFCIALLATVAGILIGYDQKPAPNLPNGITINAVISVLSTMAKANLLVVLAAATRQERWLYLSRRPAALSTVDDFEEASRGPWGSIMLLMTAGGSARALVLAAVTVLAFGFEPFLQQLLVLESENIPVYDSGVASILTPTSYDASLARVGKATGGSELVLAASIGAYGGANGAVPPPYCLSGNCTWPDHNTLAMCSVCEDVTTQVNIDGIAFSSDTNFNNIIAAYSENANSSTSSQRTYNATISLPIGTSPTIDFPLQMTGANPVTWSLTRPRRYTWSLNIDPTPDSYWTDQWQNETFAGVSSPLYAMGYLDIDLDESHSRLVLNQAISCALTPCVRTQHTRMQSYVLEPNVTYTDYGWIEIAQPQYDGSITSGWRASVNGTDFEMVDRGVPNYDGSANDFIRSLRIVLEGNSTYTRQGNFYGEGNENNFDYEATAFAQTSSPWSSIGQQAIDANGNFTNVVDQVARAISGKMQELQDTAVDGTVLRSEVIVVVRWVWLAFPLVLVVIGLGGLVATVFATRRSDLPIWKDSVLPLLLRHGGQRETLVKDSCVGGTQLNEASSLAREAELEQVHLIRVHGPGQDSTPVWMLNSLAKEKELQSISREDIGVAQ